MNVFIITNIVSAIMEKIQKGRLATMSEGVNTKQ